MNCACKGAMGVPGYKIKLPTFKLDKSGNLVKSSKGLSVSKKIAQRKSKKISVKRRSP